MKTKIKPTNYICAEDIFKDNIYLYKDEIHVSNLVPTDIVEDILELTNNKVTIVYFDPLELKGDGYIDLKKNGRVKFKLNKTTKILKQTYYYWSKGRKKYKITMIPKYVKKYCNYTKEIQNYPFLQSEIFHTSYRNTTELINKRSNLTISSQSVYLYQQAGCRMHLDEREEQLWKQIEELGIKPSGYYHYDEEYIKINKEPYVRLSIIDHHTYLIIKDILVEKDKFDKDYIKKFLETSLNGLPLECIITDGLTAYNSIIDEMGAVHQSCEFHIKQTLMKPYNKRMSTIKKIIKSLENQIAKKIKKIKELEKEYPYKQGRTPQSDKKACDNVADRRKLRGEKSELTQKLSKYQKEKRDLEHYKDEVEKIFKRKTLQGGINKLNKLLDKKDEMPELIYDFLNKLSKKIDRALAFTTDNLIPNTNNLIELFFKVTFPGKIKRIFRTYDGAMNRIRLDDVKWMERNVIDRYINMQNQ